MRQVHGHRELVNAFGVFREGVNSFGAKGASEVTAADFFGRSAHDTHRAQWLAGSFENAWRIGVDIGRIQNSFREVNQNGFQTALNGPGAIF